MSSIRSLDPRWQRTLAVLRRRLSPAQMETWLTPLVPLELGPSSVRLACPNRFYQTWLAEHYSAVLREALAAAGLSASEVLFDLAPCPPRADEGEPLPDVLQLDPDLTFDRFVMGEGNRLAYQAALAVAEEPGVRYNPLVICGEVGDGKTHLLHAIGHRLLLERPALRVRQLSAARLFETLVAAVERRRAAEFREELRATDVLLMDDVHTLASREGTQEEFFHTFNALHTAGKQLVLTSRETPTALKNVAERIRSRLLWGLVVQLKPGAAEDRLALARATAGRLHWDVPGQVLEAFVRPLEVSNRELVGLLLRAAGTAKLTGDDPETVLSGITSERRQQTGKASIEDIVRCVSRRLGLRTREVKSPRRAQPLSRARQLIAFLAHEYAGFSLPAIGRALGGRDHTTILYGVRKTRTALTEDPTLAQRVRSLRRELDL